MKGKENGLAIVSWRRVSEGENVQGIGVNSISASCEWSKYE